MAVEEGPARFLGIPRGGDAQALAFEEFSEQIADFTVIIDDQNVGHGLHVCYNSAMPGGWAGGVAIGCNLRGTEILGLTRAISNF